MKTRTVRHDARGIEPPGHFARTCPPSPHPHGVCSIPLGCLLSALTDRWAATVDPVGKLHSAEARLRMLQVFPSMMLSTVDTTRLCDLFRTELATLFDASEVFVYLEVFDIMPPVRFTPSCPSRARYAPAVHRKQPH
jgi:hypothetical protein